MCHDQSNLGSLSLIQITLKERILDLPRQPYPTFEDDFFQAQNYKRPKHKLKESTYLIFFLSYLSMSNFSSFVVSKVLRCFRLIS